jgi:hypothetical protein
MEPKYLLPCSQKSATDIHTLSKCSLKLCDMLNAFTNKTLLSPLTVLIFSVKSLDGSQSTWQYEGVSKSFRTGRLERELQMVQLSATRCSCIAIL